MSSKPIKKTVLLIKKIAEFESNWYNMKKLLMCNKNLICLLESQIYYIITMKKVNNLQ